MIYLNGDGELVEAPGPFIRSDGNYDMDAASLASGLDCGPETRTQQQFQEECDINTIVRRFGLTGQMPTDLRMPQSGDFSEMVSDYHTAANMLLEAEQEFLRLPGEVRARFQHDPGELIAFLDNVENRAEAIELGLIPKPAPAPEPLSVRVIPDPPPAG